MRFAYALLLCALTLCLTGCAGYQLGPTNGLAAREKSIQVNPFANKTLEPRLGNALTAALRKSLQKDGTFRIASHGEGDIVVSGEVLNYNRREMSFVPNDVLTVRDYRVTMTARVTARNTSSGEVILDKSVTGYTFVRVGSDLTSAERQALPLLAEDVARNVTSLLVDGAW